MRTLRRRPFRLPAVDNFVLAVVGAFTFRGLVHLVLLFRMIRRRARPVLLYEWPAPRR